MAPHTKLPVELTGRPIDEELVDRPFGTCREFDGLHTSSPASEGKLVRKILLMVVWVVLWALIVLDCLVQFCQDVLRFSLSLFREET